MGFNSAFKGLKSNFKDRGKHELE